MIIPTERGDYKTLQGMLVLPSQIFFSHSHGERYVPWVLLGQVSRSYLINRLLADSLSLWIPSFRAFHRPSNYWMRCIHIMKGNLLKVTDCKCESHLKKKKTFTATTGLFLDRLISLAKLTHKVDHCSWDNRF